MKRGAQTAERIAYNLRSTDRMTMKRMTRRERETLRESFRPKRIRLLFVGEGPPASGRFFYSRNSGLYRAMREAFQTIDPTIQDDEFLKKFQAAGCYLVDLASRPVDRMSRESRSRARTAGEGLLSEQLGRLRPDKIAAVLRAITSHVATAALRAGWRGEILELPYPGRWHHHRAEFVKTLGPALREILTRN